jgi:hypothetical protein
MTKQELIDALQKSDLPGDVRVVMMGSDGLHEASTCLVEKRAYPSGEVVSPGDLDWAEEEFDLIPVLVLE